MAQIAAVPPTTRLRAGDENIPRYEEASAPVGFAEVIGGLAHPDHLSASAGLREVAGDPEAICDNGTRKANVLELPAAQGRDFSSPGFPKAMLRSAYFAVGITNSAPLPMLSGQRCMMDFCLV